MKLGPADRARRLDTLCDELEEEIWYFASTGAKDRVTRQILYYQLVINVFRHILEKEAARMESTFGGAPYRGEKGPSTPGAASP